MYKFVVSVLLRNGKEVSGIYETKSRTGNEVAIELTGKNLDEHRGRFDSLMPEDGSEQTIFRAEDISAIKISAYQPKEA